jgi:tetratricopeptide (TPR) repeat protein
MEKITPNPCRNLLVAVICALAFSLPCYLHADSAAERALLAKAQSLAAGGHMDMAVQTWQQVLLADPNSREALLGIAKADMQMGRTDEARRYLDRVRALGGDTSDVAKIQTMPTVASQSIRLHEAATFALHGRYADAMHIYRDIYGDEPPAGNAALAYYDTEAGLSESRQHAIEGLRKLSKQFPADSRYAITMGRILTYDPKTRAAGMAVLQQYGNVPEAQNALKQAADWNQMAAASPTETRSAAPATAPANPGPPPPAANSPEAAAYRALNSGRLDEAQQKFEALLASQPQDARALSGMGYVAMKRQNFAQAANYLERARSAGTRGLDDAIATSRFWETMSRAGDALKAGDTATATEVYRSALALKSSSPDATEGLAGALMQAGNPAEAADLFERTVQTAPNRATGWRGLFLAQSAAGDVQAALATNDRMPKTVRAGLGDDPDYLRVLAEDDTSAGRTADADHAIAHALTLPFPNHGRDLPVGKQMQYAALLMTAQRYEAALQLYGQVVIEAPENADAWRALITAQHQLHRDDAALGSISSMPQSVYNESRHDSGFLVLVGSIYQSQQDYDRAQRYLEQALSVARSSPQPAIELQLADVYAAQGDQQKAYTIYRRQVDQNPNNRRAWLGLLSSLHQAKRDRDALREVATMPDSVRLRMGEDPAWLQTLGQLQAAVGQQQAALRTYGQLSQIYTDQRVPEPVDVQLQYGWALLQANDDRKLYTLVSGLANAQDLTPDQQTNFNSLWASWSIRRGNSALASGDDGRAVAILETAAQAFPQNSDVYGALAGAYLKAGQAKRAVAIYSMLDMSHGSLALYQGAIGAALAARDRKQAETWLQSALDLYKDDPTILKMAAQYEQARGDSNRAAAYYRAALEAMGPASPQEMFSHPGNPSHGIGDPGTGTGPSPAQQLMQLLAPSNHVAHTPGPMDPAKDRDSDRSENHLSEQVPAETPVQTLGDFAQSGQDDRMETRAPVTEVRPERLNDFGLSDTGPHPPPDVTSDAIGRQLDSSVPARLAASPSERHPHQTAPLPAPVQASEADDRDPIANPPDSFESASIHPLAQAEVGDPIEPSRSAWIPMQQIASTPAAQLQLAVNEMNGQTMSVQNEQPPYRNEVPPAPSGTPSANTLVTPSETARPDSSLPPALPPLTGPIVRSQTVQKTPRQQIEEQLAMMQGASSAWLGGSSGVDYRSGQPGYDRLATFSAQTESSSMIAPGVRATVIARPVLLDAGEATGTQTFRQGTLPLTSAPYVQSAAGIGGELQLRTANFGASIGYTPHGFLVENVTGHLTIHPPTAHFTLDFARDPILDTQLSFAGLRDEGSVTPTFVGNVWGGVMTNAGEAQIAFGDSHSGWYLQGGGQYITGRHVPDNTRIDGDGGAYWAAWQRPEYGNLTVGMNFFGMHYDRNLRYFTYGQGGYFSPGAYMLAAIPLTFNGHYGRNFHYRAAGSFGIQAFQEDSAVYFPLDPAIQAAQNNPTYPERTSVGGNYSFDGEGAYATAEHWYVGGYVNFNNSRDYASEKIGFFLRYLFRPQPTNQEIGPTGLFPIQGLRPLQVP